MFHKNDSFLFKAKTLVNILAIIIGLILVGTFIAALAGGQVVEGLIYLISGAVVLGVYYILMMLLLSVAVDIKFIRNKLYNYNDSTINNFWGVADGPSEPVNPYRPVHEEQPQQSNDDKYKKLAELNLALKTGKITQEEYEELKKDILGK